MLGIPYQNGKRLWLSSPKTDWSSGAMMFVFGHSAWNPQDGFYSLPKGSQVGFYNDAGELMNAAKAKAMIWDASELDRPDTIVKQFQSVQNLRLFPAPEHLGGVRAAFDYASLHGNAIPILTSTEDDRGVTLKNIIQRFPDKYIIWLGCRGMQFM
ncbi:putative adhesin [Pseudomonas botevensis]|uniref:putative adhesin n=1 Tax=Pseudomonas botevensis TaxID=2842352 RepID=UPI001C3DA166|nr:hypothetical protein [Pseudomonas botevensis]MBV4477531.1 hypothetical protein [Pseudomonas botevensis]